MLVSTASPCRWRLDGCGPTSNVVDLDRLAVRSSGRHQRPPGRWLAVPPAGHGLRRTFVNGVRADGADTGERPGRLIRRPTTR
ncbi:MAG: hypothetical protein R2710_05630 [Acidimicrobiales bacterium]